MTISSAKQNVLYDKMCNTTTEKNKCRKSYSVQISSGNNQQSISLKVKVSQLFQAMFCDRRLAVECAGISVSEIPALETENETHGDTYNNSSRYGRLCYISLLVNIPKS